MDGVEFRLWAHLQSRTRCVWGTALFLAIGCGGVSPGTQPDAMSAEAHRREAAEHERQGRDHERRSNTLVGAPYDERFRYPHEFEAYNPAGVYRHLAREQRRHAREHLDAARILADFEEAECGAFPPEVRAVCPLLGQVDAVEDVSNGVRVRLAKGIDVDAAIAHMRCHLAFARARGRVGMQECPLYLPGVRVDPVGSSQNVDLLIGESDDLEVLRLRTRQHLEE